MSQPIKLPKLLQEGCVLQRGEKQESGMVQNTGRA